MDGSKKQCSKAILDLLLLLISLSFEFVDRKCEKAIKKAYLEAKEINMLGDFNFNLLRENTGTRHR